MMSDKRCFALECDGVGNQLAAIGYETSTQLLTSFVADATTLRQLIDDIPPVVDNFPNRISPDAHEVQRFSPLYAHLLDDQRRVDALRSSDYIRALFPRETIQAAVDQFRYEKMYTALLTPGYMGFNFKYWERLIDVLENTDLKVLPALSLGATPEELAIADSFTHESNDDELLRAGVVERGRERVEQSFSIARMVHGNLAVYQEVLGERGTD